MWPTDHSCGRREAVDEPGELPEGQPNRPAMKIGSKRARGPAEEAEEEKWRRKKWKHGRIRREESNTLHIVFHFANATTPTRAAATAAVRLQ